MHDLDKYEAKVLMHRIRYERDERTPELVDRLAKYIGERNAADYVAAVIQMALVEARINGVLDA